MRCLQDCDHLSQDVVLYYDIVRNLWLLKYYHKYSYSVFMELFIDSFPKKESESEEEYTDLHNPDFVYEVDASSEDLLNDSADLYAEKSWLHETVFSLARHHDSDFEEPEQGRF